MVYSEHPDLLIGAYRSSNAKLLFDETVLSPYGLSVRVALLEFEGSIVEVVHPGTLKAITDGTDTCLSGDSPVS